MIKAIIILRFQSKLRTNTCANMPRQCQTTNRRRIRQALYPTTFSLTQESCYEYFMTYILFRLYFIVFIIMCTACVMTTIQFATVINNKYYLQSCSFMTGSASKIKPFQLYVYHLRHHLLSHYKLLGISERHP